MGFQSSSGGQQSNLHCNRQLPAQLCLHLKVNSFR